MIKILHLTHAFFPDRSGTAERIFYSQPKLGFKHFIIKPGIEDSHYLHEGYSVYTLKLSSAKKSRLNTKQNAKIIASFAHKLMKNHEIKILYGHNPLLFSLATLLVLKRNPSISLIYEPHNLLYSHFLKRINEKHSFIPRGLLKLYHSFLVKTERKLMIKSDIIISQTEALKKEVVKLYSVNQKKVIVGYNGIPEIKINLKKESILKKHQLPNDKFIIYGGDLSDNNGLPYIIKLIETQPNYSFIIAGKGKYTKTLEEYSKKFKNLFFFGVLQKSVYLELLSVSDTLLILRKSDLTNNVYLPLKILDALLLNKKVITTNLSIMREISNIYSLIFFTTLDNDKIGDKIKEVMKIDNRLFISQEFKVKNSPFIWNKTRENIANAIQKIILKI